MSALEPEARARYFEHLPAPLWAVDDEDRTIDVNRALVEALGYSAEEFLGRSPEEFLTAESRATYRAQSILRRSGLSDTFNCTFRTKSGALRVFRVSGSPIFDGDRFAGKIAILRDPPAQAAATPPVDSGAKAPARIEGATSRNGGPSWAEVRDLSHDLRNPLQAILGFAELLVRDAGGLDEERVSQVRMIADSAREALDRVARLDAERTVAERRQDD